MTEAESKLAATLSEAKERWAREYCEASATFRETLAPFRAAMNAAYEAAEKKRKREVEVAREKFQATTTPLVGVVASKALEISALGFLSE